MTMEQEYKIKNGYEDISDEIKAESTDDAVDALLWAVEVRKARVIYTGKARMQDERIIKILHALKRSEEKLQEEMDTRIVEHVKYDMHLQSLGKDKMKAWREAEEAKMKLAEETEEKEKALKALEQLKERIQEQEAEYRVNPEKEK